MKKTIFFALIIVSAACMAFAGQAKENAKYPVATLPITIQAHGNSYTITKYKVEQNGYTMIELIGPGFKFDGDDVKIWCGFISNGKEFQAVNVSCPVHTDKGKLILDKKILIYSFNTSAKPEVLIVYPRDDASKKVRINVK